MKVQLSYDQEWDRWMLRQTNGRSETNGHAYAMAIDYGSGEFSFRFYKWEADGEWFECVTRDQYVAHKQAIIENEGEEIAEIWEQFQEQYIVTRDDLPVYKLKDYWNSMMTLELFGVSVTWKGAWPHKPLCAEAEDMMAKVRDKWMQEESAAMKAAAMEDEAERRAKEDAEEQVRMGEHYHESMGGDPTEGKAEFETGIMTPPGEPPTT